MVKYYVDANIFLAVWMQDTHGAKPFDLFAEQFFRERLEQGDTLIMSDHIYEELTRPSKKKHFPSVAWRENQFKKTIEPFERRGKYEEMCSTPQDRKEAAQLTHQYREYGGHWADMIHLVLARRSGSVLATEDRALQEICDLEGVPYYSVF